jgi:nucleotide-binding universal stress UspA family protein
LCVAQPIGLAATSTYEGPAFPPELIEAQHLRVQETVAHAEQALRASGQSTVGRVYDGDPREAIVQAAERERADLLVLGSHGRSGLAKMMLGSVSSYVVTHAPCSVLVVKGPRTPAAAHHHGGES